jgi:hypothetical protein
MSKDECREEFKVLFEANNQSATKQDGFRSFPGRRQLFNTFGRYSIYPELSASSQAVAEAALSSQRCST